MFDYEFNSVNENINKKNNMTTFSSASTKVLSNVSFSMLYFHQNNTSSADRLNVGCESFSRHRILISPKMPKLNLVKSPT